METEETNLNIIKPMYDNSIVNIITQWRKGFPCGSAGKESACNVGDLGSIPGLGRSPGEGNGYPLQYSGLENIMDCTVHGVVNSRTQLSDFHFHFQWKKAESITSRIRN